MSDEASELRRILLEERESRVGELMWLATRAYEWTANKMHELHRQDFKKHLDEQLKKLTKEK